MKRTIIILFIAIHGFSQNVTQTDSLTLIFMGDIMGHESQIQSAFDSLSNRYDYDSVFRKVSPIIKRADFAIANLEVTLADTPYSGYPKFSSPDELAVSCKNSGINVLVNANNHSCDRGKEGILRTIQVLDSLNILHTGTFKDSLDRETNNLLTLEKNNIRLGLLNYTYGTNNHPAPVPTIVNCIDTLGMLSDIKKTGYGNLDKLIIMMHWGEEYESEPSESQIKIAELLFKNGADIIIGTHPHVLQKMEYFEKSDTTNERFIAYSLGNFVSNQRKKPRDGGAMLELSLSKQNGEVKIVDYGYHLTWVHKSINKDKIKFEILPCNQYESNNYIGLNYASKVCMKNYISDSRALLNKENKLVQELSNANKKTMPLK